MFVETVPNLPAGPSRHNFLWPLHTPAQGSTNEYADRSTHLAQCQHLRALSHLSVRLLSFASVNHF
jgi:hypothetical protein